MLSLDVGTASPRWRRKILGWKWPSAVIVRNASILVINGSVAVVSFVAIPTGVFDLPIKVVTHGIARHVAVFVRQSEDKGGDF